MHRGDSERLTAVTSKLYKEQKSATLVRSAFVLRRA
jgi:hypothetical protein